MSAFEEIRDASAGSLNRLNDMLRWLYHKVRGGIGLENLSPELAEESMTVGRDKLEDLAITAGKIGGEAITGDHVEALTADKITAGVLTGIVAQTVNEEGEITTRLSEEGVATGSVCTHDITITGRVLSDSDGNIDTFQESRTLYVGPGRTIGDGTGFNTFASAIGTLGKRLKDATITIYVDAGWYNEPMRIEGFFGKGSITVILAGGTGTSRTVFRKASYIQNNSVPVAVRASMQQNTDTRWMPQFTDSANTDNGAALYVSYNTYVSLSCLSCTASSGTNVFGCRVHGGYAYLYQCCLENCATASYGALTIYHGSAYAMGCMGSNGAGVAVMVSTGGHLIRKGTQPNGATALYLYGGANHDQGTVTYANSTGTATAAVVTTTIYSAQTRSWQAGAQTWRTNARAYQGQSASGGMNTGCLHFGSRPVTDLAGKTVLSARLFLKRMGSGGSSAPVSVRIYATTNITAIPVAGVAGVAPVLAQGGANGTVVCGLSWNMGGWYDIPVSLVKDATEAAGNTVRGGKALAIAAGEAGEYAYLYGADDLSFGPMLEVSYM